jgi:hypothetical protein
MMIGQDSEYSLIAKGVDGGKMMKHSNGYQGRLSSKLILSSSSFSTSRRLRLACMQPSYFFTFPTRYCSFRRQSATFRYNFAM